MAKRDDKLLLLERHGDARVWLVAGASAKQLPARRALTVLRRVLSSNSARAAALRRLVAERELGRGVLPLDTSQHWARLHEAVSSGELGVWVEPQSAPRLDPIVRPSPAPEPPAMPPAPSSEIVDDPRALFITRCDAQLAADASLTFSYMIRGLAGQPTTLKISSTGETAKVVHERALDPAATQDGVHDDEWQGIDEAGPYLLEIIHDDSYRDEAPFVVLAAGESTSYELQLLDEHEQPLADIAMELSTPLGPQEVVTDTEGVARVEAPPGQGSARVVDLDGLRERLAEALHEPCRPLGLPTGPDLHVRTFLDLDQPVSLPSARRQQVVLVARCDIEHLEDDHDWGTLSVEPGDALAATSEDPLFTLQLLADGLHRELHVVGEPAAAIDYEPPELTPPPGEADRWEPPDVYIVQSGDTLVAIAARYLGDGARWTEIWALNSSAYLGRSPDLIYPGDRFHMPPDGVPPWLQAPPPVATDPAPSPQPPTWLNLDVDAMLAALVAGDLDTAAGLLDQIAQEPPDPQPAMPAPVVETLLVDGFLAVRAFQGQVDPPMPATPDEVGHLP